MSHDIALSALETKIQQLLLDFVNATECKICLVKVDTRNFANLDVEVVVSGELTP